MQRSGRGEHKHRPRCLGGGNARNEHSSFDVFGNEAIRYSSGIL